ncbi:MAG TPA: c-type cytochrome, partial [Myxococcota bacterium]|nr:c-type cytochrome [Myxococcota bacterium]
PYDRGDAACSLALGGPVDGTWVWPLAGVAMAALFTDAALAKRAGDDRALTEAQKKGFNTYMDVGCATCHSGTYVGGSMYQKAGLVVPWPSTADKGRGALNNNEAENFMFKVPGLRNIEKTAPYFHDGSVADLDEAIRMMGKHQLGKELSPEQVADIRAYLGALTGEIPASYVAKPALPESGPKTPKPDPS